MDGGLMICLGMGDLLGWGPGRNMRVGRTETRCGGVCRSPPPAPCGRVDVRTCGRVDQSLSLRAPQHVHTPTRPHVHTGRGARRAADRHVQSAAAYAAKNASISSMLPAASLYPMSMSARVG